MINVEHDEEREDEMDQETCLSISEFIGVLSNPYRVKILCALFAGEKSVSEIAQAVALPPAHVSSHLRVLYDRGYLDRRREWKQVFYSLRLPQVQKFLELASELAGRNSGSSPTLPH
jgi:DNA-binding transcriptional ArsR family regulator